jgi:DNA polymerase-1
VFRAAEGGTRSGRFAAGRVNLQAIPHDHRLSSPLLAGLMSPRAIIGASVKDPGWGLWELDLAQAEMRVAALYAECEPMIDAFRHGRDLHGETATALFNVTADSPDWYKWRSVVAKRANFSLIFGSGWETFRTMVRVQGSVYLTAAESKRIVGDWNALYPQFQRTINHWSDIAGQHRRIQLVGGVTRHFAGFEDTHKAFNQKVQGDLAELGKDWLLETDRYCLEQDLALEGERAGVGLAGLLLVIHDSQVLLLPEDAAGRHTAEVKRLGEQVWSRLFPAIPGGVDVARWKG